MTILLELPPLFKATVIKRPSKKIKSPFVADIQLDKDSSIALGHTPSLGCCGLADQDSNVWVRHLDSPNTKCDYQIMLSELTTKKKKILVGIAPKMAEQIALQALKSNLVSNLYVDIIESEKKYLNSRFDFCGTTKNGKSFICEVKNVPLADYVDVCKKERKKMSFSHLPYNQKIAYFPDGYRKKKADPVSPRATKHVQELAQLKKEDPHLRTILLFVIQREDVCSFQPSRLDHTYLEAVRNAVKDGVELKTLQIVWKKNKAHFLRNDLPINLYD